jgi:hypothetical protein
MKAVGTYMLFFFLSLSLSLSLIVLQVRIEERVTGEPMQTDFIKTITFTGSLPNGQHELFAYICSDSRLVCPHAVS